MNENDNWKAFSILMIIIEIIIMLINLEKEAEKIRSLNLQKKYPELTDIILE